jgi:hypothetical protein
MCVAAPCGNPIKLALSKMPATHDTCPSMLNCPPRQLAHELPPAWVWYLSRGHCTQDFAEFGRQEPAGHGTHGQVAHGNGTELNFPRGHLADGLNSGVGAFVLEHETWFGAELNLPFGQSKHS